MPELTNRAEIEIAQEHISEGEPHSAFQFPIALGLRERFPHRDIAVFQDDHEIRIITRNHTERTEFDGICVAADSVSDRAARYDLERNTGPCTMRPARAPGAERGSCEIIDHEDPLLSDFDEDEDENPPPQANAGTEPVTGITAAG